ncbi:MAG: caspase domain-containing protein [Candidatus Eisenbacteria bacterium]|uniref:Caspase domain-containing protein n=1 Tax=Eiseniibacteriota bacterium TaxID=2212470 RepID=A0A948WC94_UNCEI|nr:caspase domain-containing protein [Candidatus Eisenbacteria bacterium]MBU1948474.1 caspase domain-containing protein [Candidatus Eisenbacteria bacterium]MBU2690713.1 caspase domain-containing protein [Candidatus Eisenbacteria bacterium]
MLRSACWIILLPMISLCLPGTPALAQDSAALVIGNSQYQHTARLKNPVNDAAGLAMKLEGLGFQVLHGSDLTKQEIEEHLVSFNKLIKGAEIAVFYYAGHGLQINGKNYLIPVDFDPNAEVDLTLQLVSLDQALKEMASDKRVTLIFLDACRDNPFAEELKTDSTAGRSLAVDDTRAVKVIGQGLAEVESGVGTLISFATQPGNVALDGTGEHSPFTEGLLEFIGKPGTEVSDMLKNVRKHVYKVTDGKQIPWDHSSLVERYYFKKKKQRRAPPP